MGGMETKWSEVWLRTQGWARRGLQVGSEGTGRGVGGAQGWSLLSVAPTSIPLRPLQGPCPWSLVIPWGCRSRCRCRRVSAFSSPAPSRTQPRSTPTIPGTGSTDTGTRSPQLRARIHPWPALTPASGCRRRPRAGSGWRGIWHVATAPFKSATPDGRMQGDISLGLRKETLNTITAPICIVLTPRSRSPCQVRAAAVTAHQPP